MSLVAALPVGNTKAHRVGMGFSIFNNNYIFPLCDEAGERVAKHSNDHR